MTKIHSLREIGLEQHINNTTDKHRGLDYRVFIAMLEAKASIASMSRTFKVSRETMVKWKMFHELEQKSKL